MKIKFIFKITSKFMSNILGKLTNFNNNNDNKIYF